MNAHLQERRDYGFVIGLLTGTCVGAGLAMWLAPRLASELRERMTGSARSLGRRASEQYQQASTRVGEVVGELTRKGQGVRALSTREGSLMPMRWRAAPARWSAMSDAPRAIVSLKP